MEKALFNQVGEVKGKSSENEDSFSFQFTPQNENLKRTRGALFTLVTVTGNAEDKLEKAKAYYHTFQSSYYAKATGSIINSLSETLDHVEKEFAKAENDQNNNYSLVTAVFWGAVLYLAKSGKSSVFVSRGGKLKKLDFAKVASGVLEDQDTVCLASENFSQNIENDELAEIFRLEKFKDILEKIDKRISETPGAVCDVIRLSVNSPGQTTETVTIGEVDEKGKIDIPKESEEEKTEAEKEPLPESEDYSSVTTAKFNILNQLAKIKEKTVPAIKDKLNALFSFLAKPWRKVPIGEHVDHVAIKRQRLLQIVAVIFLILAVSLTYGLTSRNNKMNSEKVDSLITSAEKSISEAKNIKSIDPNRALALVNKAKKDTAAAKNLSPKDSRLAQLEAQESELIAEINRAYAFDKLEVFADFTKIYKNAKIDRLAINESKILATDVASNKVYSVELLSEDITEIDQNFSKPKNITSFPSGFYIQTEKNITKLDNSEKTSTAASNSNWGEIVGAANYDSNLYLLDKGKNDIWKYIATSKGLSSARAYIIGQKPNLSQSSGITIDSYVWVVTKKGEIYKFALGKKQEFKVSNMQESFSNVVDIFTSSESKNLYLLDSGKARLVVISKSGVYQSQYSNDQLHQASSVVVLESKKTAYVSVNGKILSINLK